MGCGIDKTGPWHYILMLNVVFKETANKDNVTRMLTAMIYRVYLSRRLQLLDLVKRSLNVMIDNSRRGRALRHLLFALVVNLISRKVA